MDALGADGVAINAMNSNELVPKPKSSEPNKNLFAEKLMEILRNENENEESIAYKSSLLLKMLEVIITVFSHPKFILFSFSSSTNHKSIQRIILSRCFFLSLDYPKESAAYAPLPLVYVEDGGSELTDGYELNKRSGRYYRRYPWKRQNARSRT